MATLPDIPEDRSDLLPFLPMIYTAWSDGVLTRREVAALSRPIRKKGGLSKESREILLAWLDPGSPPAPVALESLRGRMVAMVGDTGGEGPLTLSELGTRLARAGGAGRWDDPDRIAVLERIESALGVVGPEAAREIMGLPVSPAPARRAPPFSAAALNRHLDRDHRELRSAMMGLLADPRLHIPLGIPLEEHRARVLEALAVLLEEGYGLLPFPEEHGGGGEPDAAFAIFETLAYGDLSLLIKYGVQIGLFGGSVHQLGTERHHARHLRAIGTLELPGCFAMTETGHGSNVRDIETTATYEPATREFVVHTPGESARKDWIGNAASHGRMATVFAQLRVGETEHGVHAFLVPLRDEEGRTLPASASRTAGSRRG